MIYRIDWQNFLFKAIDHFSLEDIIEMQYVIISAKLQNAGKMRNIIKANDLYPDADTVIAYAETCDKKLLEEMYFGMLSQNDKHKSPQYRKSDMYTTAIYQTFINPLLQRYNIMILCDRDENDYIDCLCKFLKKEYSIEVIDLNELFNKGRIGPIYIDREEIHDKAVDIRRAAVREEVRAISSTRDGKESLIAKMSKKEKLRQLKNYGIELDASDMKNIDSILLEEWCREDGQWDE